MENNSLSNNISKIMACIVIGLAAVMLILTFCPWAKYEYFYESKSYFYWGVGGAFRGDDRYWELVSCSVVVKGIGFLILILGLEQLIENLTKKRTYKYYNALFIYSVISLISDVVLVVAFQNCQGKIEQVLTVIPYLDIALAIICFFCSILIYEQEEKK